LAQKISIKSSGLSDRSIVICGGIASRNDTPITERLPLKFNTLYRYGGKEPDYTLPKNASLYSVRRLLNHFRNEYIKFVKIDTDSIDCDVLEQILDLDELNFLKVESLVLESWDATCQNNNDKMTTLLVRMARMGYTIYRVHIGERLWDDDHWDLRMNYSRQSVPKGWREQFSQRFNFVIWRAEANMLTQADWKAIRRKFKRWQFFATRKPFVQTGYDASIL
jgi:hypothetical protein